MWPSIHLGFLTVPTYHLLISLAALLGSLWFIKRAGSYQLPRRTAIDLALVTLATGFIGARLFHVFYEEPLLYRNDPLLILYVWNGGFVYLGGVVIAGLSTWYYCSHFDEPFWVWADRAVLPISFGYALGRVGCFLNGCCFGRYCELPWSVYLHGQLRHPTQLYATFYELMVLTVLWRLEKQLKTSGQLFCCWLIFHSLGRILMEIFRDDPRGPLLGEQQMISLGVVMSVGLLSLGLLGILQIRKS